MSRGRGRADAPPPGSIDLHNEELVLHGFRRDDGPAIAEALRAHIAGLLGSEGLPHALSEPAERERLDLHVAPGRKVGRPDAFGRQVAHTVYEGLAAWRP